MAQVVLIRPGSTEYDADGRIQGTLDVPLSDAGVAEAARLIVDLEFMDIEAVYTAPCQAARETAKGIAEALEVKLRKIDRLRNLNHGLWQGMRIEEVRQKQPKVYRQWQESPYCICPPEGEMLSEAEERIQASLTKLVKRHREGVIALVVAEPLASLVRRFLTHEELGDLWKAADRHGQWDVFDVQPDDLVLSSP